MPIPFLLAAVTVPIIYGYKAEGLYHGNWAVSDLAPLFDAGVADGYRLDEGALRQHKWHVWDPARPLTVEAARRAFAGKGVALDGGPAAVTTVWTDGLQAFGSEAWFAGWMAAHAGPDARAREKQGALWHAHGADGTPLVIYSENGSAPPASALAGPDGWRWEAVAHGHAQDGEHQADFHAIPREFGGIALHALADRLRKQDDGLRVDAGNLVDDVQSPDAEIALPDTLAAVGQMGLDALVPFDFELRLPHEDLARLAQEVPLVAANLQGPEDVPLKPFVVRERKGKRIAIVGLVDAEHVKRYSLYGAEGWKTQDPLEALPGVLAEAKLQHPDAIVLVTNVRDDMLPALRDRAKGVAAIVTRFQLHGEWDYKEHFEPGSRDARQALLPWAQVGGSKDQIGKLTLGFEDHLKWMDNEVTRAIVDQEVDPDPARSWAFKDRLGKYQADRRDAVLPDRRTLAGLDERLAKPGVTQYDRLAWTHLAAGALRQAADAEIALLHVFRNAPGSDGEVPRYAAENWLKRERVVLVEMRGKQLKDLLARDAATSPFVTAGFTPGADLVGGRPLDDTEVYRVVTTDSIARSEHAAEDFVGEPVADLKREGPRLVRGGEGVDVAEGTLGVLDALRARQAAAYPRALVDLMFDDGAAVEPQWRVEVRDNQLSYERFLPSNPAAFDQVRNAQVNSPQSTFYRMNLDMALLHLAKPLDWENRLLMGYQRAETADSGPGAVAQADAPEQDDLVMLTSEVRLKALGLPSGIEGMPLIPFANTSFVTEFSPTARLDNTENPLRKELYAVGGLLIRREDWLKELRLGAVGRDDLAAPATRVEPGLQLGATIEQPLADFCTLTVDADLRHYFPTALDTPADLAWLNRVEVNLLFPLGHGLNLRIGADSRLFYGKVAETQTWGTTVSPIMALSYNGVWKPRFGVLYDPHPQP